MRMAAAAAQEAARNVESQVAQERAAAARTASIRNKLGGLREAARSKQGAFGGLHAARLAQAVERASAHFHRPPIGPMGQYLALQDTR